jgi:hypothetical protein
MRLQTQWVMGGMGAIVGLNYQSVATLFKIYRTKDRTRVFESLQIMEAAVLRVIAEDQKGKG